MSIEAHGQLGKGIIFATNAWGQYVKFAATGRNPNTAAQRAVRKAYGDVFTVWRALSDEEQEVHRLRGRPFGRTGANQFFHENYQEYYP